ncbi:phospho-N-acetylmuramoyl-pentapeptide-transferase [Neoactinobaculum massilliense]|uniref:phospho-N-acetylmuramoyl-pentapeptide- transferase n=1 Tax=Neoactinobaculum massilliense TaxID=2364794 RepID=UPI000F5264A2|nr:phospho-N-acetylmuramoyl-pentapeptide-transferase [Neoactinobaculum massilliense]
MLGILISGAVALLVAGAGTPLLIRVLVRQHAGQFIRQDGPTSHLVKRGTPTMGGLIIMAAVVLGFAAGCAVAGRWPSASGLLLIFLMLGMGAVGFADDFIKISKKQSLGLTPWAKMAGLALVGIVFSAAVLGFPSERNLTPASFNLSFVRDLPLTLAFAGVPLGVILFILWSNFLISAWSNAVNLTDGLDGLSTGTTMLAFGAYTLVAFWQNNHQCTGVLDALPGCYQVRDPWDVTMICAAMVGACFGFLWWNTSPAQIFMGDTGSLAIGGLFAGVSIVTHTELLALFLGGLYLIEVLSDVIQVGHFKLTGRRVFRMAPIHHHFELAGWKEITVVVRFWIIEALFAAAGVGMFYMEWLSKVQ